MLPKIAFDGHSIEQVHELFAGHIYPDFYTLPKLEFGQSIEYTGDSMDRDTQSKVTKKGY